MSNQSLHRTKSWHSTPSLHLRRDLIIARISLGRRDVWVLKDPLSQTFHFFEEHEYAILRSLERVASHPELTEHFGDRIDGEALMSFVGAATRAGLLASDRGEIACPQRSGMSRDAAAVSAQIAWWKQPLAIRLPGITPDRVFKRLFARFDESYPLDRIRDVGRPLVVFGSALMLTAMLIVFVRLGDFTADFSAACSSLYRTLATPNQGVITQRMSGTLFLFALAIMVTKIIHELAHAFVCSAWGARCRELGVLLLFGVPCLYCDVSDTWLMPRRRDRILVSAAGMMAECLIAAIAVWVWALTDAGMLHDLAALVVVVASLGTLGINANPLLRYDGYYILSDWIGVPNLAAEAGSELRTCVLRVFRPIMSGQSVPPVRVGLVLYAIASGVYRLFVMTAILLFVYLAIQSRIGLGAALPIVLGLGFVCFHQRVRNGWRTGSEIWNTGGETSGEAAEKRRGLRRGLRGVLGGVLGVVVVLLIPLPESLRVGGWIRALDEHPRYLTNSGMLLTPQSIGAGTAADFGASFDDWRLRLQVMNDSGTAGELAAELSASRIDRLQLPNASLAQPILVERLASARQRHQADLTRLDALSIRLGQQERIFPPPPRRVTHRERSEGRWTWTGSPLDESNVGATIDRGTLLGHAGHPTRRVAALYVRQQSIDAVRIGDRVSFGYASLPVRSITGNVIAVSDDPVDVVPEEITASMGTGGNATTGSSLIPGELFYEVTVSLDTSSTDGTFVIPVRTVLPARILLPWRSLLQRIW